MERGVLYAEEKGVSGQKRRGGQVGEAEGGGGGGGEDIGDG